MNYPDMPSFNRALTLFTLVLTALLLVPTVAPSAVLAQDSQPSQQDKAMHYSLYYENYKNNNFQSAKSDLRWILSHAPGFPKGDDRNFERQVKLYEGLAEQASGDDQRKAYLDSAATVLTTAADQIEEHGLSYEPFEWEIMKGRFLEDHQDALPDLSSTSLKDPVTHYRKAFELAPKEVNPFYIQRTLRLYLENNQQQKALALANTVGQKRGEDDEVAGIVSSVRNDIFGKNPQARINYLKKQREAHPDSTALLRDLFAAYVKQGNVSKASELAPEIMASDPSPKAIREIAQMRIDDGRPKGALDAYDRLEEEGESLTAEDHYQRGKAYQEMDQLRSARRAFRKAIEANPEFGRAYIAIGDLYTRAVSECSGGELSRTDKSVYWAAVDKFQRAKQVDPSVASTADRKVKTYTRYFPTQEDIFYREQWTVGESFTINSGCYSWIGERTTVRQAP